MLVNRDVVSLDLGEEMRWEYGCTWNTRIHVVGMA